MGTNQLEKLEAQRKALDERIRRAQAKVRSHESKKDTRRKILAGAVVTRRAENDSAFDAELQAMLDQSLTRDDDRALFGLKPLVTPAATKPAASETESIAA